MSLPPMFWRSPRLRTPISKREIELLTPPQEPSPPGSLIPMLLPALLTIATTIGVGLLSGTNNMLITTVPMLLVASLGSLLVYHTQKRNHRRKLQERELNYRGYLETLEAELQESVSAQCQSLLHKDPAPGECLAWASTLRRSLWGRSPGDDDFLSPRIELGSIIPAVTVKIPARTDTLEPDPLPCQPASWRPGSSAHLTLRSVFH